MSKISPDFPAAMPRDDIRQIEALNQLALASYALTGLSSLLSTLGKSDELADMRELVKYGANLAERVLDDIGENHERLSAAAKTNDGELSQSREFQLIGYRADLMRHLATGGEQQVINTLASLQQIVRQAMETSDAPVFDALKVNIDIALTLAKGNAERSDWVLNGSKEAHHE
jgi:hypothetical protein